jgi:hypothetical protein
MAIEKVTDNGEILLNTETGIYTVYDETYSEQICLTYYEEIARAALRIYGEKYLDYNGNL